MATKFQSTVSTGDLSPEQYIMLSRHAFEMLGWQNSITSRNTIQAFTKSSFASQDQQVNVTVNGNEALIESKCIHGEFVDLGRNRKNVNELVEMIDSIKEGYVLEELQSEFEAFEKGAIAEAEEFYQRVEKGELTASEKMSLGVGGHKVTWTLIGINVLVFILMALSGVSPMEPSIEALINWGAMYGPLTTGGQWWRLITAMFVHIGIVHLLMNMYALYAMGTYLEPMMGRWKILAVYMSTGLIASVAQSWWAGDSVGAGASGAIFGLFGIFTALLTTDIMKKEVRKPLLQSMGITLAINLIYGLTQENLGHAAHIGGLVSGIVFGYIFYWLSKQPKRFKLFPAVTITIAVLITITYLKDFDRNDTAKYELMLIRLDKMYNHATAQFQNRQLDDSNITAIEKVAIPTWKEMVGILNDADSYEIPEHYKTTRELYKRSLELRIHYTRWWIDAHKKKHVQFDSSIISLANELKVVEDSLRTLRSQ